jgi:hypothetical protein
MRLPFAPENGLPLRQDRRRGDSRTRPMAAVPATASPASTGLPGLRLYAGARCLLNSSSPWMPASNPACALTTRRLTPSRPDGALRFACLQGKPCGLSPPRMLGAPEAAEPAAPDRQCPAAKAACPPLKIHAASSRLGVPGQGRWPVALSRCASSRLRRLAPVGLPSFPRSARLTPPARLPASGLRASLAVRSAQRDGRCLVQPSP